ncbi:MAG: hypothetical protein E6Z03_01345 [Negativicoccus succinicivorans]|uniref:hypothetical protein n=1 Tax=Negativicoccus succinicivorans TaxID=620903 RepID=UPI00290A26A3|nr:hypothetical protein [Negativicoccus succinicivorans]MDU5942745.1 hypothetical protein [Negativicoccus succinicivorans]
MLERKAREAILEEIRDRPRISKQEAFDLVKLHYSADIGRLINKDIRRLATNLTAQVRDDDGRRQIFSVREKGDDRYVNIDLTENKLDLQMVQEQLVAQRDSRDWSIDKVTKRLDEVAPKKLKRALRKEA